MIPSWLGSPEWTNVVGALLHTLWQGTLIAVLLGLVLRRLTHPVVRYRYALGALVGVIAAGLVTWGILCRPLPAPTSQPPPNLFVTAAPAVVTANDSAPLIVQVQPLAPKAPDVRWTAWLALLWVVGTMLMLGRAAFQVAGAERLRRSSRPLEDPRIMALLAEAREAVGLMRRVRLAVTDQLTSPVVAGVLVPTLILPLSLVSSIAPEQIRFILLHELAHIRRGDYFANLFQLFAEALLFFNPAVWWISRQMRLEREACCDALAVELSGAPADYARTLVRVVENALSPAPAAAPALGDRREPSSLADRLQRMLVPGYRPALRLTWRAMFAALLMGGVLLFLSALGTRVTIAAIPGPTPAAEVQPAHGPAVLIQAEIYQASPENLQTLVPGLAFHAGQTETDSWWLASPAQFAQLQKGVKKAGLKTITRPRIQTWSGEPAQFFVGNDDGGTELDCQPTGIDGQVQLDIGAKISDRRASSAGTNSFAAEALLENHGGMVFSIPPIGGSASNFMVMVEVQIVTNGPSAHSNEHAGVVGDTNFQATLDALKQRTGFETLGEPEITTVAGRGENRLNFPPTWIDLTNRVGNSGLENSNNDEMLHARTFFLNPAAVGAYLETPEGARTNNVGVKIKEFLSQHGVDWKYGKEISYNETYHNKPGVLWIKATDSDLDIIETALLKEHWSENFTNFEAALRAMEPAGATNLVEPEGTTITPRSENPSGIFPGQQPTEVDPTNGIGNGGSAPSPGTSTTETAKTITFKLEHPAGQAALEQSLEQAGVQFPATALFYTDGGAFLARGTAEQLALINGVVRQLNGFPTDHPDATAAQFIASLQPSTGAQTTNANHLYIRTFKVDQSLFLPALQQAMKENLPDSGSSASPSADPSQIIRDFFQSLGLDLSASSGESVSYNPQRGLLYVKVTDSDFDTIGRALQLLNTSEPSLNSTLLAPQIHIAARFIEVPVGTLSGFASFTGGQLTGILTDKNARVVLKALKARDGTEVLAEPEIVMLSGHRAQMRATEIINAVTNIVADANGKVIVQTGAFETGPALDVIPHVLADGYTINLEVIPTLTVFEGYADQGQTATNSGLPLHPPVFQTQKLTADVNLWDNQTLVLGGMEDRKTTTLTPTFANMPLSGRLFETKTNEVLILVTATMVDATGSRVHTDAEMPFAQSSVPTQPPSTNNGVFTSYGQPAPTFIKANVSREAEASALVEDGKLLYEMGKLDEAEAKFKTAFALNPDNASAKYYLALISVAHTESERSHDNTNQTSQPRSKAAPPNDIIYTGPGRQKIVAKLNSIHLDSVSWNGLPLSEVLRQLSVQCKALDPEHKGVNFLINNNRAFAGWPPYVSEGDPGVPPGTPIDPATGPPLDASSAGHKTDPTTGLPWATEQPDAGSYIIKIPSLTDIRLADALDAIVMVSDHPLKYSIQDFAIVFSPRSAASPQLFTQTFLVDPNTFDSGLEGVGSKSFGVNQNNNGGSVPVVGVVNTFSGEGAVRSSGNSGVGGSGGGGGGSSGDATLQSVGSQEGGALYNSTAEMAKMDLFMTEHHPWDNPTGGPTNNPATNFLHKAVAYFTTLGINFQSPPGKLIFYNHRTGVLTIKATTEDLDKIKRAIRNTNTAPTDFQILIY